MERVQKLLARAGLASRRQAEQWIDAGRVLINQAPANLGARVAFGDTLTVDGQAYTVARAQSVRALCYHKPIGQIVSRAGPDSVFSHLPDLAGARWVAVGRLDVATEGLLLFTSDGDLANRLMHPSHELEREYQVRVDGDLSDVQWQALTGGVNLDDGPARFNQLTALGKRGRHAWYRVILREGRNREVRRLWASQGFNVSRLIRVRYGPIRLSDQIKPRCWRELSATNLLSLYQITGLPMSEDLCLKPSDSSAVAAPDSVHT